VPDPLGDEWVWGNPTKSHSPRRRETQGETPGSGTETRPPLEYGDEAANSSGNGGGVNPQTTLRDRVKRPSRG